MDKKDFEKYICDSIVARTAKYRLPVVVGPIKPKTVKKLEDIINNYLSHGGASAVGKVLADTFSVILNEKIVVNYKRITPEILTCIVPLGNSNGHNYVLNRTYLHLRNSSCCDNTGHLGNSLGNQPGDYRYATDAETEAFVGTLQPDAFTTISSHAYELIGELREVPLTVVPQDAVDNDDEFEDDQ